MAISETNTKFLKLPVEFSVEKLIHDLSLVLEYCWIPHFNKAGYIGDWKAISLYATDGIASNIFAVTTPTSYSATPFETPVLKKCSYFKEVIDFFKCEILSARLLRFGAGAQIKST